MQLCLQCSCDRGLHTGPPARKRRAPQDDIAGSHGRRLLNLNHICWSSRFDLANAINYLPGKIVD